MHILYIYNMCVYIYIICIYIYIYIYINVYRERDTQTSHPERGFGVHWAVLSGKTPDLLFLQPLPLFRGQTPAEKGLGFRVCIRV